MRRARILFLTAMSTVLLGGCGGGMGGCGDKSEDMQEGNRMGPIVQGTGALDEEGPQYQQPTVENLKQPQKFPAKYPAKKYPNSRVVMAYVRPDLLPGRHNVVLLNSDDPGPLIANYYFKDLTNQGWKPVFQQQNSIFSQIKYQKGNQEIEVRVTPDPHGRQHVQILSGPYVADKVYERSVQDDRSQVGEN